MTYKRQVAYLDYMEFGEKKGNGGFCKWEQKKGIHSFEISVNVSDLHTIGSVNIFTRTGKELGRAALRNGRATALFLKEASSGNWQWEFSKITIPLGKEEVLLAEFPMLGSEEELTAVAEPIAEFEAPAIAEPSVESEALGITEPIAESEAPEIAEPSVESEAPEITEPDVEPETFLYSLWDSLIKTHSVIRPFGTEAEYCRIMLEDIFLLKEKYHVLKNNPFLLHGYYNYKYLILGKKEEDGEEYWLGVPGIYHEREKVAARMYGFEKFEGAKAGYRIGDLGYYLITAE